MPPYCGASRQSSVRASCSPLRAWRGESDAALAVDLSADRPGPTSCSRKRREQHSAVRVARAPARPAAPRAHVGDHARVDGSVALGVVVRVLGCARQIVQPRDTAPAARPSRAPPVVRRRAARQRPERRCGVSEGHWRPEHRLHYRMITSSIACSYSPSTRRSGLGATTVLSGPDQHCSREGHWRCTQATDRIAGLRHTQLIPLHTPIRYSAVVALFSCYRLFQLSHIVPIASQA